MLRQVRDLYTDLLVRCLCNSIYKDDPLYAATSGAYDAERREQGSDFPSKAHSMAGMARLRNLAEMTQHVLDCKIPGDFIETGVWRGGCCILMRGILAANAVTDRTVHVADSFRGLPKPDAAHYPADEGYDLTGETDLAVSVEQVRRNFEAYGLLDGRTNFVEGWFSDTLPALDVEAFALIRLDGDLYESTIVALRHLYPKLSVGGVVIIDDYGCAPPCKQATDDYRRECGIDDPLRVIDWTGVCWTKTKTKTKTATAAAIGREASLVA